MKMIKLEVDSLLLFRLQCPYIPTNTTNVFEQEWAHTHLHTKKKKKNIYSRFNSGEVYVANSMVLLPSTSPIQ